METVCLILVFLLGFIAVHFLKMLRFYLVLLEQKPPLRSFLFLYLKTTFVNLLIPFKLGEVYRAYCVTRLTGCVQIGILGVVLDRFFDIFSLLVFLLPYDLLNFGRPTLLTGILVAFLAVVMLLYHMFLPTYGYLNRYMIRNSRTKRGIYILSVLEMLRGWYDYIRDLLKGRQYMIVLCSAFGWMAEALLLQILMALHKKSFGFDGFAAYISSIFSAEKGALLRDYSRADMAVLGAAILIMYLVRLCGRGRHEKKVGGNL